jgi:hypothetical protein
MARAKPVAAPISIKCYVRSLKSYSAPLGGGLQLPLASDLFKTTHGLSPILPSMETVSLGHDKIIDLVLL